MGTLTLLTLIYDVRQRERERERENQNRPDVPLDTRTVFEPTQSLLLHTTRHTSLSLEMSDQLELLQKRGASHYLWRLSF